MQSVNPNNVYFSLNHIIWPSASPISMFLINVTQRGSWYPSGELGNSSKPIIKGYMEKNMKNRLILFKTFTSVKFHGENNEINKNVKNLMTIALWEFFG